MANKGQGKRNSNYNPNGTLYERKFLDIEVNEHKRLFRIWKTTIYKCSSSKHVSYKYYGGRGISVCDDWLIFSNFINWAYENGYDDDLTIDRIDSTKDYCPENCRWVTWTEQQRNRSNNRLITINDESHTAKEWEELTGIHNLTTRLKWKVPEEELFNKDFDMRKWINNPNKEVKKKKSIDKFYNITINGVTKTLRDWCKELGHSYQTMQARKKRGVPDEELFNINRRQKKIVRNISKTINGETHTIKEWAKISGIKYNTLLHRYDVDVPDDLFLAKENLRYRKGVKYGSYNKTKKEK